MKRFLTLLLLLLPFTLWADNVTEQQARELATQFLLSSPSSRAGSISLEMVFNGIELDSRSANTNPPFYVFNNSGGKGFVIVAGDDVVMPLLGYSTEWNFASNPIPYNVKGWLEDMSGQINSLREAGVKPSPAVQKAWKEVATRGTGSKVTLYETALWHQDDPFNKECPTLQNRRADAGCVPLSMAIVMKYHGWPDNGVGTVPAYSNVSSRTLGASYNWSSMPLRYDSNVSQESKSQVARLIADCGAMVQANYANYGTAAAIARVPSAIISYMKYSANTIYRQRDSYSTKDWHALLQESLDANGPIIYGGQYSQGGHAFVLDGYNSDHTYHVNWGWGGYCNGNYSLDALNPSEGDVIEGYYNTKQEAILNMKKSAGETAVEDLAFMGGVATSLPLGLSVEPKNPKKGENFHLLWNTIGNACSSTIERVLLLIALTDANGTIKEELLKVKGGTLPPSKFYSPTKFSVLIRSDIHKGDRLRLFFNSAKTSSWKLIKSFNPETFPWEIVLDSTEENIKLGKEISFMYDKKAKLITFNLKEGTTVKLKNSSNADISNKCHVVGGQCKVNTEGLSAGNYQFIFEKGGQTFRLNVTL